MHVISTVSEETPPLFISAEEAGIRIDKFLSIRFPGYSRTYFQQLIALGLVLINGEKVKKRILPEEGDEVEVCFQAVPEISLAKENIPLKILYEDDHLLAVDKPAGMVVHPGPGHYSGTFVNALLYYCQDKLEATDPLRPGIVHRLDKDTSGVLIAAKTSLAHQKLVDAFSHRTIEKVYLAICKGKPCNQTIRAPIGRHPTDRKKMSVQIDGKEAISEIQVVATNEIYSLCLVRPKTGRTHQIRVHLKHIGLTLLGDSVYGIPSLNAALQIDRQLLHAYQIKFQHPITQECLQLSAPIPGDFKHWIQRLFGKDPLV